MDGLLTLGIIVTLVCYLKEVARLIARMERIDDILLIDQLFGAFLLFVLLESVRRLIG
ncbi:MAG: hypothetical protein M2R45_00724 [Verrucomicrobia subdivision 3 bacterium]|nr:hypothetical protein [Limisphaerales bacterium]MCS1414393.1 hypothetical protein [Limisphaerales bacterium]